MPFVLPTTLLGAILALANADGKPDLLLPAIILANHLAVAYAFMINDIEDAPDDALDPARAARNPVTCGEVSPRVGWLVSLGVAALALLLYGLCGLRPLAVGAFTLALSHLYSWKPVRLKARPVFDIVSHALMLSALLVLGGYLTYHDRPGDAWLMILAAFLGSAYGQLYNQLRDYEMDKAAGLHNTAIMVGERAATMLMYGSLGGAAACVLLAIVTGLIPLWLVGVAAVAAPVVLLLVRPKVDMRGGEAVEVSGDVQIHMLVLMNLALLVWLLAVVAGRA